MCNCSGFLQIGSQLCEETGFSQIQSHLWLSWSCSIALTKQSGVDFPSKDESDMEQSLLERIELIIVTIAQGLQAQAILIFKPLVFQEKTVM